MAKRTTTPPSPASPAPVVKRRRSGQHPSADEVARAQQLFLDSFRLNANITHSCRAAGIVRATFYRWQEHDETFSLRYKDAEHESNELVEGEIFRRAVRGVQRPLHFQGRLVTDDQGQPVTVTDYSDTLLMFMAKKRMPQYRDRQQVAMEVTGKDGGPIATQHEQTLSLDLRALSVEQLEALRQVLTPALGVVVDDGRAQRN